MIPERQFIRIAFSGYLIMETYCNCGGDCMTVAAERVAQAFIAAAKCNPAAHGGDCRVTAILPTEHSCAGEVDGDGS
jgi:hypothetical protein